jgi:TIR domain
MKVFISWSGESSRQLAQIFHEWIPSVVQNVTPYMSAENIDKGERWSIDIANQLQETNFGIVCITPDNTEAPWILFESGALSKSLQNARVSPIIFGLSPSDLTKSPLLQFQLTQFNQNDIHKLIISINNSMLDAERLSQDILNKSFNRAWNELEISVNKIDLGKKEDARPAPAPSELGNRIDEAIQEILTNTRSQIKILNSPADLLPAGYFKEVIKEAQLFDAPVANNHPAWRDIDAGIEELEELSVKILDSSESVISDEGLKEMAEAIGRIKRGTRYIRRRIYEVDRFRIRRAEGTVRLRDTTTDGRKEQ